MSDNAGGDELNEVLLSKDRLAYDHNQNLSESGRAPLLRHLSSPIIYVQESLEKGRVRSASLSLISCALGTAVLALPNAFSESGLLVGAIITFLSAALNA